MTADIKPVDVRDQLEIAAKIHEDIAGVHSMAAAIRAGVHAIDSLRAEVETLRDGLDYLRQMQGAPDVLELRAKAARAERLAEALRRAEGLLRSAGIIAESDLERPHSIATEIKNALRDYDQEDKNDGQG